MAAPSSKANPWPDFEGCLEAMKVLHAQHVRGDIKRDEMKGFIRDVRVQMMKDMTMEDETKEKVNAEPMQESDTQT